MNKELKIGYTILGVIAFCTGIGFKFPIIVGWSIGFMIPVFIEIIFGSEKTEKKKRVK